MDMFFAILQFVIFCLFSLLAIDNFKNPKQFFLKILFYIFGTFVLLYIFPKIRRELNIGDYFFENPLILLIGPLYYLICLIVVVFGIVKKIKNK